MKYSCVFMRWLVSSSCGRRHEKAPHGRGECVAKLVAFLLGLVGEGVGDFHLAASCAVDFVRPGNSPAWGDFDGSCVAYRSNLEAACAASFFQLDAEVKLSKAFLVDLGVAFVHRVCVSNAMFGVGE